MFAMLVQLSAPAKNHITILYAIFLAFLACGESYKLKGKNVHFPRYDFYDEKKWIEALDDNVFPQEFLFGVSTSAYQTEGTWNMTGESLWDYSIRANPGLIKDGSNASIAADSYRKYKEDIHLAKHIGAKVFRISLSWTRIFPDGFGNNVNQDAIRHYNRVIDEMVAHDIKPMITLLHGDMPNRIQKWGGLLNPLFVDWFTEYARVAFCSFGDRVQHWITMNDPTNLCLMLYGDEVGVVMKESGVADYYCGHHALLAHAKVYNMYHREFGRRQKGKIGIAQSFTWYLPINPDATFASTNAFLWYSDWLMHPIFDPKGDYPSLMKHQIGLKSALQGYPTSRLPSFTEEEIRQVQGSADFLGFNFKGIHLIGAKNTTSDTASFKDDAGMDVQNIWTKFSSWPFVRSLTRLHDTYNIPELYITEVGYKDVDDVEDLSRTWSLHSYMVSIMKFMQEEETNIRGCLIWSLIDSFEWLNGYKPKFGLFRVDFNDTKLTRTPRLSSKYVAHLYKKRTTDRVIPFLAGLLKNRTLTFN